MPGSRDAYASKNGEMFNQFLKRHPHLTVVNSLDICQGLITRRRNTTKKNEKAVLDFFVVCHRVLEYVENMIIDEDGNYELTNFISKSEGGVKPSDHATMLLNLNLSYSKHSQSRLEIYNLKNSEGQAKFFENTSRSESLMKCFENSLPLKMQVSQWEKKLKSCIAQSFNKIRLTNKKKETESQKLIVERNELRSKIKTVHDMVEIENMKEKINDLETKLSNLISAENTQKFKDNLNTLCSIDGAFIPTGFWKIKRKCLPKNGKALPVSKINSGGRLVSNPVELKQLYLRTYEHRLRHRPIKPGLEDIKTLKELRC